MKYNEKYIINKSNVKYKKTKNKLGKKCTKAYMGENDKILPRDIKENLKIHHIHGWEDLIL